MNDKGINERRRSAIRFVVTGIAAIPFANLVMVSSVRSAELPHLSEDDAQAKGLQYVHDATKANRPDKAGTPGSKQFCNNCQLLQGDTGEWRPCAIFAGKAVNANGWCAAWVPKAS